LLLKSGLEERPPNHHQLPNQPLVLAIAGVDHDLIIFSPSVITLLHTLRGGLCLIVVQLSLHSADSTLTSGKHLLLWGGLLAPAVSRWPTIVWVCAKVLLHRSSSTSSAYLTHCTTLEVGCIVASTLLMRSAILFAHCITDFPGLQAVRSVTITTPQP
jgi:hypothetical protein